MLVQGRSPGLRAGARRRWSCASPTTTATACTSRWATSLENPHGRPAVHRLRRPDAGPRLGTSLDRPRRPADGDLPRRPVRRAGRRRRGLPELPALHPPDGASQETSAFVPAADGSAPVPDWKRSDWACDVLAGGRPGPWLSSPAATFLALGATIVVGACSSDDSSTSRPSGDRPAGRRPARRPARQRPTRRRRVRRRRAARPPRRPRRLPSRWPTIRSRSASRPATPTRRRPCCGPGSTGADLPDAVDVTWELADDDDRSPRRRPRARRPRTVADGHSVHVVVRARRPVVVPLPARRRGPAPSAGWRRLPAGAADQLRIATASCQHWETGFYAAHRDIAEWAPDLVVFLGDFIYEGAGQPIADGPRPRPRRCPSPPTSPATGPATPQYLSDPDLQAARAAAPWLVDLGRPRGREQLRRPRPAGPRRRADVRRHAGPPPTAPGGSTCRCGSRRPGPGDYPIHRSVRWGDLADLVLLDGRQYRSDQACGCRPLSTRSAVPGGARPGPHDARRRPRRSGSAPSSPTRPATWTVLAQQTVLTDLRFGEAILNYDQWDGYAPARDRLLAQAAPADRVVVLTGDIHLAGVGVLPASASSSSRLDLLDGPDRPRTAADPRLVRRRRGVRARPPRLHAAHGDAGDVDRRVPHRRRRARSRVGGVDVALVRRRCRRPRRRWTRRERRAGRERLSPCARSSRSSTWPTTSNCRRSTPSAASQRSTLPWSTTSTRSYYDTADLRLAASNLALRRRAGGDDAGWHLKESVGDGERLETHAPLGAGRRRRAGGAGPSRPLAGPPPPASSRSPSWRTAEPSTGWSATDDDVLAEVADDHVTGTALLRRRPLGHGRGGRSRSSSSTATGTFLRRRRADSKTPVPSRRRGRPSWATPSGDTEPPTPHRDRARQPLHGAGGGRPPTSPTRSQRLVDARPARAARRRGRRAPDAGRHADGCAARSPRSADCSIVR